MSTVGAVPGLTMHFHYVQKAAPSSVAGSAYAEVRLCFGGFCFLMGSLTWRLTRWAGLPSRQCLGEPVTVYPLLQALSWQCCRCAAQPAEAACSRRCALPPPARPWQPHCRGGRSPGRRCIPPHLDGGALAAALSS